MPLKVLARPWLKNVIKPIVPDCQVGGPQYYLFKLKLLHDAVTIASVDCDLSRPNEFPKDFLLLLEESVQTRLVLPNEKPVPRVGLNDAG